MSMINCSKEKYLQALAERKPTRAESEILRAAAKGLFNYLEYGRQIAFCTWLMVARADARDKLALQRLDIRAQHDLIRQLRAACPDFFAGMLVEPEPFLAQGTFPAQGTAAE